MPEGLYGSFYTVLLVLAVLLAALFWCSEYGSRAISVLYFPFSWSTDRVLIYGLMLIALWMLVLIFMALYVFLPDRKKSFLSQFPGAVFATLSWCVFSYIFSIYLGLQRTSP